MHPHRGTTLVCEVKEYFCIRSSPDKNMKTCVYAASYSSNVQILDTTAGHLVLSATARDAGISTLPTPLKQITLSIHNSTSS